MIWLLLAACSDKDGSDDTGKNTDDTGDTGDVVGEFSCPLGALSPFTVPIDEDTDITTSMDCSVDAELTAVTLDGEDVEFEQSGTTVKVKTRPKHSGQYSYTFWLKPLGKDASPVSIEGEFRAHTAPVFEEPPNLKHFNISAGFLEFADDAFFLIDSGNITVLDASGTETSSYPHNWKFKEDASCTGSYPIVVCADVENAGETTDFGWVNLDSGTTDSGSFEGTPEHFKAGKNGPSLVMNTPVEAGPNNNSSGGIVVHHEDYDTPFTMGDLKGDVRLLDMTVLVGSCTKDNTVLVTELSIEGNKQKSETDLLVPCGGDWWLESGDYDNDGDLDELHVFAVGDDVYVTTRENQGNNSFIKGGNITLSDSSVVDMQRGSVLTVDGNGFGFKLDWNGENPVFVGQIGDQLNAVAGDAFSGMQAGDGTWWVTDRGEPWLIDQGPNGEQLTRTVAADGIHYALDGEAVPMRAETPYNGLYDGHLVSITTEDLVIDEREMTTGADWDYVVPVGGAVGGQLWLARANAEKGVGLTLLDLDDPDATEEALKGLPIFVAKLHYDTTSEDLEEAFVAWEIAAPPNDTNAVAPSLVALIDTDNGCALTVLRGTTTDLDDVEIIEEAESCDALPVPIASGDYLGDGGTQVVLTNGRLLGVDSLTCILVFGPTDENYRMSPGSGDVNGDGLVDVVVAAGEDRVLLLSQGDGTFDVYEGEVPAWIWMSTTAGNHLRRPVSSIFPTSWAAMLD